MDGSPAQQWKAAHGTVVQLGGGRDRGDGSGGGDGGWNATTLGPTWLEGKRNGSGSDIAPDSACISMPGASLPLNHSQAVAGTFGRCCGLGMHCR